MVKKTFDPRGQKEIIDSLSRLLSGFVHSRASDLARYVEKGFGGSPIADDPIGKLLRDGARFLVEESFGGT